MVNSRKTAANETQIVGNKFQQQANKKELFKQLYEKNLKN